VSRRRSAATGPDGFCVVDKPAGWTSHDVVAKARGLLGTRKVGHAGTLDPLATGVLVLGVGAGTRLLTFVAGVTKTYRATIRFGQETDTLDADGRVTVDHGDTSPDPEEVRGAAAALTGDLLQVPPMVSAVKVDGRRLHELAREGKEVERAPRPVRVEVFDVVPTEDPLVYRADVRCSSGTYVRVLASDLGHAVGSGAHLTALRRTAVGPFDIDEARGLDRLELLGLAEIGRVLPVVAVDDGTAARVRHGAVMELDLLAGGAPPPDPGPWAVTSADGELLAVYAAHRSGLVKPAMVLPAAAGGTTGPAGTPGGGPPVGG
jgi:tRNA pseudouridine55 synthase